ncbi:perlucin-like [Aplysia californica]|uniref:Perlucin-like n=1 Tax=Aplysia californica TaxID=6500 RepID=A0ABM0JQ33_APLCA|nr:perlucin-like [Aplysia californica]
MGGFVAEVYSDQENEFLKQMMRDHGSKTIWLGADDLIIEGKWYWATSGTSVDEYSDWAPGQPDSTATGDENCMEFNLESFGGHWNDDECDHHQRFICQKYITADVIG